MLRSIVSTSLKFRLLITVVAALLLFVGGWQLRQQPVDVLPEFSEPFVEVQTEALGLSATEVEQLITVPLEADLLNGVAWLKTISSRSIPGLSSVTLVFEPGTDIIKARQMVQERLTQAVGLPNVSKPPVMLQPLSSANRVMQIGLAATDISNLDMSVLARWTIRPRLMGVPGVANVAMWGLRNRQLQVQVDPERLRGSGVTLTDIIETTGESLWVSPLTYLESSTPGTGGWIDTPNQRLGIRHLMPITSSEQLSKVAVKGRQNAALEDFATVVEDHQPLIGDAVIGGSPGLMLVVEKFPWANTTEVTRGVESAIEALRPGLTGVEIDTTLFRPATYVESLVSNLERVVAIAAVLVIVVLLVFFLDLRMALISVVAIAASLIAAALVYFIRGAPINMMVIAGMALALPVVIDDAVVDTHNIKRRLRQRGDGESAIGTIVSAALETRGAMLYATFILLLAVMPIFAMTGLVGSFLQAVASSYIIAILASLVVALLVTPALSSLLLSGVASDGSTGSEKSRGPRHAVGAPLVSYALLAILLVAGAFVWLQAGQPSLTPTFKENDLLVELEGSPGTGRAKMSQVVAKMGEELRSVSGVRNVSANVGRATLSDEVANVNYSEIWVSVDPSADYEATVTDIEEVVDGYPGLERDVSTFLQKRMRGALPEHEEIAVRVYGQELDVLREKAEEVRAALSQIDGLSEAKVVDVPEEPSVEITADLDRVQAYGLRPGDIRRATATLLSGLEVGQIFEEQKVFDVVVWGVPQTRHSLSSVGDLLIDTPNGDYVPLKDVADIAIRPVPTAIQREGVARYIDVIADLEGRSLRSASAEVDSVINAIDFPLEYHAELRRTSAEMATTSRRVTAFAVAAVIAVLLLLQAAFNSWKLAIFAFLSLLAVAGGAAFVGSLGSEGISLGSLAGILAAVAIAARHSISMIRHFQDLEYREGQSFGEELVTRGLRERATPILIAAVATAAAMLPILFAGNAPGLEILRPMAITLLGGLVASVVVSLFVLPALFLRFGANARPDTSLDDMSLEAR